MTSFDSVGTLLADIAKCISDGLRLLSFADKTAWGQDEHEQVHALEAVLDEAKRDFQTLSPLVNGQAQYEADRNCTSCFSPACFARLRSPLIGCLHGLADESVHELRNLSDRFRLSVQQLQAWARSGGPINPVWIRDTHLLQRALHRAQCRAAGRIFRSQQESSARCLGAFCIHRKQRAWSTDQIGLSDMEQHRRQVEELMVCNEVGGFERFADQDIAYICDFCDGHLIWEDLESIPTVRASSRDGPTSLLPSLPSAVRRLDWQAWGSSLSAGETKRVLFAPFAIANHTPPRPLHWQAGLLCPLCEDEGVQPQDEDDEEEIWRPDNEFEDVIALHEHLEWQHSGALLPESAQIPLPSSARSCSVM